MKKLLAIFICLLLCGCENNTAYSNEKLDAIFNDESIIKRQNNFSTYIDYYLPSDLYEEDSSLLTSVFSYNNSKIVSNINVSGIINCEYYVNNRIFNEGFFDEGKLIYHKHGSYLNNDFLSNNYDYQVYQYDDTYLLYFNSDELIIYSFAQKSDIVPVTSRIFVFAKGANVKKDDIILNYSTKDVIDYQKVQVNLFESVLPVNGRIDDMMLIKPEEPVEEDQ